MRWRRIAGVGTICAAAALAVAGCGGSGGGTAAPPAPGGTGPTDTGAGGSGQDTTTAAPTDPANPTGTTGTTGTSGTSGTARCRTVDLRLSLRNPEAGAGQRYLSIVLTNSTRSTCQVYGYGGIQLVDAAGRAVPTKQVREASTPPRLVTLAPGASAYSAVHWTAIASGAEPELGACEPVAHALRVIPPDEHAALSATWTYGSVCGAGRIDQRAYRAGTGQA